MYLTKPSLFLILGCILFVVTEQNYAQNSIDNSINKILERAKSNIRVSDSLVSIGGELLTISKKHNNSKAGLSGYYYTGLSYYLQGDFKKTIQYYDSALVNKKRVLLENYPLTIKIIRNRAISYARSGKPQVAKQGFLEALEIAKEKKDFIQVANTYSDLGIGEKNQSNFTTAISYYDSAMKIWDSLDLEEKKTAVLLNIGVAQGLLGNKSQSTEAFREVARIAKKYNKPRDEHRAYSNLVVNFRGNNQLDSAIVYINKSLPRYKKLKLNQDLNRAYQNLSEIFEKRKQLDSAQYYADISLSGFKKMELQKYICESYNVQAKIHLAKKEYDRALAYTDSSVAIATKLKMKTNLVKNYSTKAEIYEALEDYKNANTYLKLAEEIEDENFTLESANALNEILTKHQVGQKEKEIKALNSSSAFYKSTSFIITLVSLVLLFLIVMFWLKNTQNNKELAQLRTELKNYKQHPEETVPSLLHLKSKAVLDTKKLLYIKSDGHYLEFYSEGNQKPEIDRNTLKDMTEKLTSEGFAQIHKSYLVNLSFIRIINSTKIMLDDGTWLPLSRTYKPMLKQTLLQTNSAENS